MSNDDDKGGFVIGGIGFGVGPAKPVAQVSKGPAESREPAREGDATPLEVDGVVLPLRVLVLSDLVARPEWNAGIYPPDEPVRVHATDVDALFGRLAPKLALDVESVLHEGAKVRVDVPLTSMLSFRPDALCRDVALLRGLVDGKKILERLRDGALSLEAAATELSRLWQGSPLLARVLGGVDVTARAAAFEAPRVSAATDDAADRILGMLDLDGSDDAPEAAPAPAPRATGGGRFDGFLSAVAHSGKSGASVRPDEGIRRVEKALGIQLAAILQHPEFRRLEESWRGLAFLVGRTPKTGVRLDVLSCRPEEAPSALRRIASSGLGVEAPVTFAVVDHEVSSDAASLRWLRDLSEAAESSALVALTNASPALFGARLDDVDRLDNKQAMFDAPERAPWRAEANRPSSLWVSLALNRILVRTAYDAKTSRVRDAQVAEAVGGTEGEVWMQPAWAVATLAVKSHQRYEWPCGITGARDGGLVENLPVRELGLSSGERIAIPTEAFLSTETQRALARIGLLALASQPNSDAAYLMMAATAYVPPPKRTYEGASSGPEERLPQASLGDQLFVARLAQQLEWLGQRIVREGHHANPRRALEAGLGELFRNAPPSGPELEVALGDDAAEVTIRPRRFLGVGLEELTLRVPLR